MISLARLAEATRAARLDALPGHSLHVAGTLEYLLRDPDFDTVELIGRWKSEAFQLYLREHTQVLAPYLHRIFPRNSCVRATAAAVDRYARLAFFCLMDSLLYMHDTFILAHVVRYIVQLDSHLYN